MLKKKHQYFNFVLLGFIQQYVKNVSTIRINQSPGE